MVDGFHALFCHRIKINVSLFLSLTTNLSKCCSEQMKAGSLGQRSFQCLGSKAVLLGSYTVKFRFVLFCC